MDLNLVVMCGRLATSPDLRVFDSGTRLLDLLLTVRSGHPHERIDVLPVTFWNPPAELVADLPAPGARIWVTGRVQRRFHESVDGRRSRIEIVADQMTVRGCETDADLGDPGAAGIAPAGVS